MYYFEPRLVQDIIDHLSKYAWVDVNPMMTSIISSVNKQNQERDQHPVDANTPVQIGEILETSCTESNV